MSGLTGFEKLLLALQVLALVVLLARLVSSGLHRVYRFFFFYLAVELAQVLIPLCVNRFTNLYGNLFFATEGVILCLYALVVLELYSLVLQDLPGISSISKRYLKAAIVVSIALSLLLMALQPPAPSILASYYGFESTIVSSLVLFVLLITLFLVYYPVPLNRNVIYYSIGYAIYFTSKVASLLLMVNSRLIAFARFSEVCIAVSTGCLVFWSVALNRAGESKTLVFGHQWNQSGDKRLLEQLQAINANLLRARK